MDNICDLYDTISLEIDEMKRISTELFKKREKLINRLNTIRERMVTKSKIFYINNYINPKSTYKTTTKIINNTKTAFIEEDIHIYVVSMRHKSVKVIMTSDTNDSDNIETFEHHELFDILNFNEKEAVELYRKHLTRKKALDSLI